MEGGALGLEVGSRFGDRVECVAECLQNRFDQGGGCGEVGRLDEVAPVAEVAVQAVDRGAVFRRLFEVDDQFRQP